MQFLLPGPTGSSFFQMFPPTFYCLVASVGDTHQQLTLGKEGKGLISKMENRAWTSNLSRASLVRMLGEAKSIYLSWGAFCDLGRICMHKAMDFPWVNRLVVTGSPCPPQKEEVAAQSVLLRWLRKGSWRASGLQDCRKIFSWQNDPNCSIHFHQNPLPIILNAQAPDDVLCVALWWIKTLFTAGIWHAL